MKGKRRHLLCLIPLLCLSQQAAATRYLPLEVPDATEITDGNSFGTLIGKDSLGNTMVWLTQLVNEQDPSQGYKVVKDSAIPLGVAPPTGGKLPLPDSDDDGTPDIDHDGTPVNLDESSVKLIAINNPKVANSSDRLIIGSVVDDLGHSHGLFWTYRSEGGGVYDEAGVLPPYHLSLPLCTQTSPPLAPLRECYDDTFYSIYNLGVDPDDLTKIRIANDEGNLPTGVNADGVISGISYSNDPGYPISNRPVFWIPSTTNSQLAYVAHDLGATFAPGYVGGSLGPRVRSMNNGRALAISADQNSIAGTLQTLAGTQYPVIWQNVTSQEIQPVILPKNKEGGGFSEDAVADIISGEGIAGYWLETIQGVEVSHPMLWSVRGDGLERSVEVNEPAILDSVSTRFAAANETELVGNASDATGEQTPFLYSASCGAQDINELLVTKPASDDRLIEALVLTEPGGDGLIVANGDGPAGAYYLLLPVTSNVDVSVDVATDHDRLVTGQEHNYTITITNSASAIDAATCISVTMEASVYLPSPSDDNRPFEQQDGRDRRGGMTFNEVSVASGGGICNITEVQVFCRVDQLDPGQSTTILLNATPRPLLADRTVQMYVIATPSETDVDLANNREISLTKVDREGCFIATAAYGSYLHPHVDSLRDFRDRVLMTNSAGKAVVAWYYRHSPVMAEWLLQHPEFKPLARAALAPLVYTVQAPATALLLVLLSIGAGMAWRRRPRTP